MSIEINKLRSEVLKKRNSLNLELRELEESRIIDNISQLKELDQANCIAVFAPYKSEVNIWPFIKELWSKGKTVVFPKVNQNVMHFYKCIGKTDFEEGYKGILEPKNGLPITEPYEIDILFAPGSVFSSNGQRIGYGGGFYDKYLSQDSFKAFTVGVGFSFQVVEAWKTAPWDVSLDAIVTF